MKNLVRYMIMAVAMFTMAACSQDEMFEPVQHGNTLQFVVGDFPAYDAATRAIGTPDAGKTAWENGDHLIVTISGNNMADQSLTLTLSIDTEGKHSWASDKTIKYDKKVTPELTVTAIYAPCYEVDADGNKVLKEGMQLGMTEYLTAHCDETDGYVKISFDGVIRDYSRLRIAGAAENTYTVTTTGFTPVGGGTAPADGYSLTTDEKGNAYLYGTFAKDATVTVKDGETELRKHTFTGATEDAKSYVLDAIPTHTCDETTKTYYVYKAEGLYAWLEAVQNDLTLNLTLMADITLPNTDLATSEEITVAEGVPSGSNWTPFGSASNFYTGTIEGNDYTINGLVINSTAAEIGFVGATSGATIQNLNLTNVSVSYSGEGIGKIGAIVGWAHLSSISGCTVTGSLTCNNGTGVVFGGIAGWSDATNITDCSNEADIAIDGTVRDTYIGGIAGKFVGASYYLSDCTNRGNLTGGITSKGAYTGGIVGDASGSISGCTNSGSVTGGSATNTDAVVATGGIAGNFEGGNYASPGGNHSYYVMHKNTNNGTVIGGSATNIYTGGLVGMETSYVGDLTTYESVVFSCNSNTGAVKDITGNTLNNLVGWSAYGEQNTTTYMPEGYQPLSTLTACDDTCSSASGE